ncbi:hypothetical protein OG819_55330 [Streptomyces sp. NBC_01549]|uniref:hypothetical protein n=1 Tax=Streptomyces sp. NBC_01549 TaxID=2975874 RepID=UPI00224C8B8E|nr:hypothetical protein [Streptomyces sp. NBC_01549]MCX4598331.1 hypothetical protein [Streptomyces sp. NBC_01549]
MFELLVLLAVAYAGARGVEKVTGADDRRYDTAESRKTVERVASSGPKDGTTTVVKGPGTTEPGGTTTVVKAPGPTEPGGTFSAAAPRSAKAGGKVAYPFAVITETGSTMWKATVEGYREQWPQIREEHRRKMEVKATERRRKKEEAEAKKKAEEAKAKAGPPPPYPPMPAEPPKSDAPDAKSDAPDAKTEPEKPKASGTDPKVAEPQAEEPQSWPWGDSDGSDWLTSADETEARPKTEAELERERAERERWRADRAEAARAKAQKEAEAARDRAARDKVLAAQKAEREAKEREAAAERRARDAEAKASEPKPSAADPETDSPAGRRHLSVVPDAEQNGDLMSSPASVIPEIRTLDGLMNALTLTKAMCEMRSEEAIAIAADDKALSDRLDQIEAEMAEMEVDDKTRLEVDTLREDIHTQSAAAARYGAAAKDAGDFAVAAAAAAYKSHGGIAEAVQSSPIERAAQAGYYDR